LLLFFPSKDIVMLSYVSLQITTVSIDTIFTLFHKCFKSSVKGERKDDKV
jgi:hypothetical protein